MISYNIKEGMPSVELAIERVKMIIKYEKASAIKLIHGYGSTGVGGKIKKNLHSFLDTLVANQTIKTYIPGEAFGYLFGYDEIIRKYQHFLKTDENYKRANEGITYIIM